MDMSLCEAQGGIKGLTEKLPRRWYLNSWFPIGSTIWGCPGGSALLEVVCHWIMHKASLFSSSLSLLHTYSLGCGL